MADYTNLPPVGKDFRALIERLRRENTGEIEQTVHPQNVPFVIGNLFDAAKEKVAALIWRLNDGPYAVPSVGDAAVKFLRNNPAGTLEILCETKIDFDSPLMKALIANNLENRVGLWEVPPRLHENYKDTRTIADGSHYLRIYSRARSGGVVQFGKTVISEKSQRDFDWLRDRSAEFFWPPVPVPPLISVRDLVTPEMRRIFPSSLFIPKNTPR